MRCASALLAALAASLSWAATGHSATIPVTTTADTQAADGLCSLREAVFAARFDLAVGGCPAGSGPDVVQLEAGEYRLAAGGANEDGNMSGDLDTGPFNELRVVGRGMGATVVGGAGDRLFDVFAGASLGLADLTLRDGTAPGGGSGGAVRNRGALTVLRVAFVNTAAGDGDEPTGPDDDAGEPGGGGGAIASEGQLQVSDAVFSGTRAGDGADGRVFTTQFGPTTFAAREGGDGGAILVSGGSASLANVTVVGSRAGDGGERAPDDVVFAGGSGGAGGAIAVTGGSATLVNGTFVGNRAGDARPPLERDGDIAISGSGGAAAALAPGTLAITFSTFAGNAVGSGPGGPGAGASVAGAQVGGSILADAGACATPSPAFVPNVVLPGDSSCPGARIPGDPRLGPLGANGGSVPTMAPGAGSPAIDAVVGVPCPAADARGLPRPALGGCDAGAVEVQAPSPAAPAAAGPAVAGPRPGPARLTGLRLTPAAFRAAGRRPLGTTVRYRLSAPARVVFTVRKARAGRRKGRRCVAPGAAAPGARRCVRVVTLPGRLVARGRAGQNALRFTGRLGGKALAPGAYVLVARVAGARTAVSRAFRVLAR